MSSQSELFRDLSANTAGQTLGGSWGQIPSQTSVTVVKVKFYPGRLSPLPPTINITNPRLEDGSVLNVIGGDGSPAISVRS